LIKCSQKRYCHIARCFFFFIDEIDFQNHVEYIHYNPVKHGLVTAPKDWEYSSFHRTQVTSCHTYLDAQPDENWNIPNLLVLLPNHVSQDYNEYIQRNFENQFHL
ncbi:MAG: hypothetical protein ACKPEQ_19470, partial [Dolichospermum sp.]